MGKDSKPTSPHVIAFCPKNVEVCSLSPNPVLDNFYRISTGFQKAAIRFVMVSANRPLGK